MEQQVDIPLSVTTEDIQAVMRANPMVAMQVQNQALMRRVREQDLEVTRLTAELEKAQNGKSNEEASNADSRT
tara:strand:- start:211 stop:429 length:219 start_codon:yes stop_codon:yes gene_type:complete